MRVALLTTDNREHHRRYDVAEPYFGPAIEALLDGLAQRDELEVHVIACTQRPMAAPEKLARNVWFHLLDVPKRGWLRTGYQGCVRAIRKRLRDLQPDIVHGQGTERECGLSAALSGFPCVATIHGNMREVAKAMRARPGSYLWCAARLESFTLPRLGGVFCNSAYTESVVAPRANQTWRVPNALRRAFLETPPAASAPTSKPILLCVGAVLPYKRQHELLAIARALCSRGLAFELHFIGTASAGDAYGAAFLKQVRAAEQEGFARYLGEQSAAELIARMDAASALVHLSTEESFGLVVAEGLARNLKFFGSTAGGIPDIAQGVEGAEIFQPRDQADLTAALARWLELGVPRPKKAAQEMKARYHPDVIAGRHLEIYQHLLGEKSGHQA